MEGDVLACRRSAHSALLDITLWPLRCSNGHSLIRSSSFLVAEVGPRGVGQAQASFDRWDSTGREPGQAGGHLSWGRSQGVGRSGWACDAREVQNAPALTLGFSPGGSAYIGIQYVGSSRGLAGILPPGAAPRASSGVGSAPVAMCPWATHCSSLASVSSLQVQLRSGPGGL